MASKRRLAAAALVAVVAARGVEAHHSVAGQFDTDTRLELRGVIAKVDWINPHTYLHLEVPNDDGSVTVWRLESAPTAMLRKARLTPELLMDGGSTVKVAAYPARDGTPNVGFVLRIDYADGHYYQLSGER